MPDFNKKEKYIKLISMRGDHYGYNGGLYDLLTWTGRISLADVTEDEARFFYENPEVARGSTLGNRKGAPPP